MTSAVERGALFLDEKRPGWWKEIDVDRLNMGNPVSCVLGQLCGSYGDGLYQLGITPAEQFRLGFYSPTFSGLLTEPWEQAIADRLQAA